MSGWVIEKKVRSLFAGKSVVVYAMLSLLAVVVNEVYGMYGHGVHSPAMTWMFLYPLLGGAGVYLLLSFRGRYIPRQPGYRLFRNLYNSGIATLTAGSFLQGILEIAGATSPYLRVFYGTGILLVLAGMAALTGILLRRRDIRTPPHN